jgi:hypothetical protein
MLEKFSLTVVKITPSYNLISDQLLLSHHKEPPTFKYITASKPLNKSMEQSFLEASSHSPSQEISWLLWNQKVQCHISESPLLDAVQI